MIELLNYFYSMILSFIPLWESYLFPIFVLLLIVTIPCLIKQFFQFR